MLSRSLLLAFLLLPAASASAEATPSAQRRPRLSHEELMALAPSPDVRPTFDAGGAYSSGGIGILVYDGVNVMDAIGPLQVFSTAGLRPFLVSATRDESGAYKTTITANSGVRLETERTIANTSSLEVLVVTGGALETAALAQDAEVLAWIRAIDQHTVWTTSVCTGAWVLGAAGLLKGHRATSNWYRVDELLQHFGAFPRTRQRYVFDGKLVTAAGVTAGIDMALALVKELFRNDLRNGQDFTQAVMLDLEYDPAAPISGGSRTKTDPYVYEGMQEMYDFFGLASAVLEIPAP